MRVKLKENKGFTTIDMAIAMLIIAIFAAIVASVMYSLYVSNTEAKRTAVGLNYAVDIFEKVGTTHFSDVTAKTILSTVRKYYRSSRG